MANPPAIPADTSLEAFRVHLEVLRRLGMEGRARLTFDLCESLRQTTEAGVRFRHPDYDDRTVRLAATRLRTVTNSSARPSRASRWNLEISIDV